LGLATRVGRAKNRNVAEIKGRVRTKFSGWKEKFMSQAGKEILIKAIIQVIPIYNISVFQLHKTLCKESNSMISKLCGVIKTTITMWLGLIGKRRECLKIMVEWASRIWKISIWLCSQSRCWFVIGYILLNKITFM
jgi:hypothetical protein